MKSDKVRLMLDFPNLDALKDWARTSLKDGTLPAEAAVFQMDGLDDRKDSGITPANTFIVRRAGDRPQQAQLKLES